MKTNYIIKYSSTQNNYCILYEEDYWDKHSECEIKFSGSLSDCYAFIQLSNMNNVKFLDFKY